MKTSRAWIIYTVVRLLAFAVPFMLVMLLLPTVQWNWLIAVVVASVIGFLVSLLFLRSERLAIGGAIMQQREGRVVGADAEAEDAVLDEQEHEQSDEVAESEAPADDAEAATASESDATPETTEAADLEETDDPGEPAK
ncbi:DUF4229 domain-containing protein [Gulosibacter sp. ACHW.36C]|uniref:DUF4229 domain-containing protein n=1 Tax=Gulosibacter sediminis TaxID=1729695 RepID=A0ABY4MVZ2_9MICO|nr:DUF4229 domain-containing protein [Gulosibacter sediminis]UQN14597.1 DUF4229 domain-containing protein [Gulosibacter sediminis]